MKNFGLEKSFQFILAKNLLKSNALGNNNSSN